jgi:hypothetical protein
MSAGQHRYEKTIGNTQRAVAAMRSDYYDLDSPSPRAYMSRLRDQYTSSTTHMTASFLLDRQRNIIASQHYGLAMARLGIPASFEHVDVLFNKRQFTDGVTLGLAASRHSIGDNSDQTMAEQLSKVMDIKNVSPQAFAQALTLKGLETYELDLDCPPVEGTLDEGERPSQLKTFANQLLGDLYDNETQNKAFKIGLGIARYAYNSYVILGDSSFEQIMADIDFDFESPGQ